MYWRTQRCTKKSIKVCEYTRSTLIYYKGDYSENPSEVLILQHPNTSPLTDYKMVILKVLCRHTNSFRAYCNSLLVFFLHIISFTNTFRINKLRSKIDLPKMLRKEFQLRLFSKEKCMFKLLTPSLTIHKLY